MARAKKLPSGNWRVQVFAGYKFIETEDENGNKFKKKVKDYQSFSHPDKAEAEYMAAEFKRQRVAATPITDYTVKQAMEKYIESRSNILSPTTLQGYKKIIKNNLQDIMQVKIKNLTLYDIQAAINADAEHLSAKTLRNAHGLLASVLKVYRPSMRLTTSIPQRSKKYKELPPPQKIFEAVHGTDIELPVLLSMWLSFSKSEIRGIKKSDVKDGVLTLQRAVVDVDNKPVEKKQLKAYERVRRHVVPQYIMELINKCETDYIVTLDSYQINYRWKRALAKNSLPHMPFHDLRHVNASVMHLLGIPDKYAMERGGWKTDATMKAVYQNVFTDERLDVDKKVNGYFNNIVGTAPDALSHNISHDIEKSP